MGCGTSQNTNSPKKKSEQDPKVDLKGLTKKNPFLRTMYILANRTIDQLGEANHKSLQITPPSLRLQDFRAYN